MILGDLVALRAGEPDDAAFPWWDERLAAAPSFDNPWFVVVDRASGTAVGRCWLENVSALDRSADVAVLVDQACHGHGYGTDAVRTLCRFAVDRMNLVRLDVVTDGDRRRLWRDGEGKDQGGPAVRRDQ